MSTIATGDLTRDGAVLETAGGTKVAIFRQGSNMVAYTDIDGTPTIIGSAQTPTVIFGGGAIGRPGMTARIDSTDVIHIVAACTSDQTRDISYNTISHPDGTPAWGTWELIDGYANGVP